MAITQQQYADLADFAYKEQKEIKVERVYAINGSNYKILAHSSDKKTDYQGTIYQKVDTGEIIVAHRGTEPTKKGDVAADHEMASKFTNPQISHALKLTEMALGFAQKEASKTGKAPEVTVTGHSLGGALAQVSAFEYGLKAQTFNAYGAAGLKYTDLYGNKETVPFQNNGKVTNHMMAGDVVSAANNHFGRNVIYARPKEIESLKNHHYGDGKPGNNQMWRAAKDLMGSKHNAHNMPNFTNEKGPSILSDPKAKELAQKEAATINEYRNEIKANRGPILRNIKVADKVSDAFFPSKSIFKKIISDNTDHSQEKSTLYAQKKGKGDLNDIINNDVKSIYAKLESSLGPQLADKGAGKWAAPMIAATTYACVEKGMSADKIAHIGINEKENVLYAVSANRRDFATVDAIEASKVNPEQTLLAANQLHDQLGIENQQKEMDRQMQMNQQQHGGIKFA
ncbi:lipase family protein [Neisseria sp. Ec49-e6-T10]|uniref:lipase family protein n=1 Tax=Neisseria sp. Ec49-e6-T10 TaxID=3140744 RepID=UPI003EB9D0CB